MSLTSLNRFLNTKHLQLLNEDQLPPDMREIAILKGYRPPKCTVKQCLISIITATNETLNIWTHFIPTLYFCWKLAAICDMLSVLTHPYTWPFVSYMITICTYPLISALAHTFYSISNIARHIWFFLDYGALSLYSYGAGLLYRAYVFPEDLLNTYLADNFLNICFLNALFCTCLACWSRFMRNRLWIKVFRLGAFFLPWIWDSIPLLYRIAYDSSSPSSPSIAHYAWQFLFSFMIGFFYASHLPERLAPGKFDIIGHSHQLLHIAGVMATNEQMNGAFYDMTIRRNLLENDTQIVLYWSLQGFLLVIFSIITIICYFSWYALKVENGRKKAR